MKVEQGALSRSGPAPARTRDVYYGYDHRGLQTRARFDSFGGEGVTATYDGFGRAGLPGRPTGDRMAAKLAVADRDGYVNEGTGACAAVEGAAGKGEKGRRSISGWLASGRGATPPNRLEGTNMALQFLSDAEVGDSELVIRLDLDGLHTLLKALTTALEARLEQVRPEGGEAAAGAGGEASNAFGRVTVEFVDPAREEARPDLARKGGARGSGETACWEMPSL